MFVLFIPGQGTANSAPEISSYLPIEDELTISETESISFSVDAVDADGDALTYSWEITNLNTMDSSVVSTQHTYTLVTDYNSAGVFVLNVTVEDINSNSSQTYHEWDIIVNEKNRAPSINVMEPLDPRPGMNTDEKMNFRVSYEDSDINDELVIRWLIDGEEVATGLTEYEYFPQSYSAGTHIIMVQVTDGKDVTRYSWNVTVSEPPDANDRTDGLDWNEWAKIENVLLISLAIVPILAIVVLVIILQRRRRPE
jgi:hypothetical protein